MQPLAVYSPADLSSAVLALQQQRQRQQQQQQRHAAHTYDAGESAGAAPDDHRGTAAAAAAAAKRPRLVWTPELHKLFEEAVAKLGVNKAVPKTIMQVRA
jgi:hypothetical protein